MADLNDETIRDLDSSIRELTNVMQTAMGITGSSTSSQSASARATKESTDTTNTFNARLKDTTKSTAALSAANKNLLDASYMLGQSMGYVTKVAGNAKDTFVILAKTMADTKDSFSKYGAALNSASDLLSSSFGSFGKLIGIILKPLTMVIEALLGFQDNLFAAKDDLAKFGAVGKLTTTDILDMATATKFSSGNIQQYAKIVSSAGIGLIGLGGTVNQGIQSFTKLAKVTDEEQRRLLSFGISIEEYTQNVADFVKLQTMSGKIMASDAKSQAALQRAAKEYTENLVILAAISGEDVNTQKQKQMQLAMEYETQFSNLMRTQEIGKLRDAAEKGNIEAEKEADRLQRKMDEETATVRLVAAHVGMDQAKALAHRFATGIITPEYMKIMHNSFQSVEDFASKTGEGTNNVAKFVEGMAQGTLNYAKSVEGAIVVAKEFGISQGVNSEFMQKMAAKGRKTLEEQLATILNSMKNNEVQQKVEEEARAERIKNEQETRKNLDIIARELSKGLAPVITDVTKLMTNLTTSLKDINWEKFVKGFEELYKGIKEFDWKGVLLSIQDSLTTLVNILKTVTAPFRNSYRFLTQGNSTGNAEDATPSPEESSIPGGRSGSVLNDTKKDTTLSTPATASSGTPAAAGSAGAPAGPAETSTGGRDESTSKSKEKQGSERKATEAAIIHHTGGRSLAGAISTLKDRGLGYHYLIDRDGSIHPFMSDNLIAHHAGKTDKNKNVSNSNTIGIAAVAGDDSDVTKEQIKAAMDLHKSLSSKYGYSNVFGHGDVSGHKNADEGRTIVDAIRSGKLPGARLGGSFSGPNSGYPVMLHGSETVVPTPNPNTTLLKLEGDVVADKLTSAMTGMNNDALKGIMQELYSMMEYKLTEMVDKLSTSNDLQDKLLKVQM